MKLLQNSCLRCLITLIKTENVLTFYDITTEKLFSYSMLNALQRLPQSLLAFEVMVDECKYEIHSKLI